jgi:hypothetical protein
MNRENLITAIMAALFLAFIAFCLLGLNGCGDEITKEQTTIINCPIGDCLITERSMPCVITESQSCADPDIMVCLKPAVKKCPVVASPDSPCVLDCMVSMASAPCISRKYERCVNDGIDQDICLNNAMAACPVDGSKSTSMAEPEIEPGITTDIWPIDCGGMPCNP